MGIFDKIFKKEEKTSKIKPTTSYEDIRYISERQAEVAANEANAFLRDLGIEESFESPEELKEFLLKKEPERLYVEFKRFLEEVKAEQQSKQNPHQEQPKANDYENWDLSHLYDIRPPDDSDKKRRMQQSERIKKYNALCKKGYIDESFIEKLNLPYILEKKESGQTLTQSEQQVLAGISGESLADMRRDYTKAVLMLETIGLIDNYSKAFPKTEINASLTIVFDYGLFSNEDRNLLLKALADECNQLSHTQLPYFVEKAIQSLKSEVNKGKTSSITSVAMAGIGKGITPEDLGKAYIEKDSKQQGGR